MQCNNGITTIKDEKWRKRMCRHPRKQYRETNWKEGRGDSSSVCVPIHWEMRVKMLVVGWITQHSFDDVEVAKAQTKVFLLLVFSHPFFDYDPLLLFLCFCFLKTIETETLFVFRSTSKGTSLIVNVYFSLLYNMISWFGYFIYILKQIRELKTL